MRNASTASHPTSALGRPRWALLLASRLAIAGVFLFAAVPKISDPQDFARSIDNYHLLPSAWVPLVALLVPLIEAVVAGALIAGIAERGAALIAGGMLLVFAGAIAQALWRGIDIDCGCFGKALESQATWTSVARNLGLSGLAALVVWSPHAGWLGPSRTAP